MRILIHEYPGISEQDKYKMIDLVTIVVFKLENYRKAFCELETFVDSLEKEI